MKIEKINNLFRQLANWILRHRLVVELTEYFLIIAYPCLQSPMAKPNLKLSLRPISTIKVAIADGLSQMLRANLVRASKVGDGARHLEDTGIGARGERQPLHSHAQQLEAFSVWLGVVMDHALGHLSVAVYILAILETFGLYATSGDNPFANFHARLARRGF